ncbi:tRNA pseudouridine(38-40) synthase TruA [Rhodopila sp.]|uniref:tRNA pseudouridine(38-40) synthase TruA n=1 Tax=Rhodopila sp. TaxID=2480087 RepID=UPI003D12F95F
MTRWALLLEYDGTGLVGWQRQAQGVSIQGLLEQAAERLNHNAPVACIVAGRTDAGVHAEGQVAQIDLPDGYRPEKVRDALNFHLKPHRIVVVSAVSVPADWNARFTANRRTYRYRILNRRSRPALLANRVWHVAAPLDADAMHHAAQRLLGRHDFTSFRAASCQAKSPIRTLDRLDVHRDGDIIEINTAARSFLHHQVRNLVGTLKLVGDGHWPVQRVTTALQARNRAEAGPTAPAEGLTLMAVGYPDDLFRGPGQTT